MELGHLQRELEVLSHAVHYPNLSGASANIGLSQPQLSRIILKLEKELQTILLDRSVRRKASWTPTAHRLAQAFIKYQTYLVADIQAVVAGVAIKVLRMGTLEGLIDIASETTRHLFEEGQVERVHLNVYDLNELEEFFLRRELDVIFTLREPGRKKYQRAQSIGRQSILTMGGGNIRVLSEYEFLSLGRGESSKKAERLVSNSLAVRRLWTEKKWGTGQIPTALKRTGAEKDVRVIMLAHDFLPESLWRICLSTVS